VLEGNTADTVRGASREAGAAAGRPRPALALDPQHGAERVSAGPREPHMSEEPSGASNDHTPGDETTDETEQDDTDADTRKGATGERTRTAIADATATTGETEAPRTQQPEDVDEFFRLLASPGNRFVLTYLLAVESHAEYADLVESVVSRVEAPQGMTKEKFRGRVAATLISETLPRLEAAGFVEVDGDDQMVQATGAIQTAAPHLALALSDLVPPSGSN